MEYNFPKKVYDKKVEPYLNKIKSEVKIDEGKYNKLLRVGEDSFIDIFGTHEGVMVMADFCDDSVLNKLEKLAR